MRKVYEEEKISAIADAIREKTGSAKTYTTTEMPNGINEVYQNGEEAMLDSMWEALQGGGTRTNYNSSFFDNTTFTKKTFKPKYDIRPTGTNCYLWTQKAVPDKEKLRTEGQVNMIELEKERGIVFDFSNVTSFDAAFAGGLFSHLSTIDLKSATSLNLAFSGVYLSGPYQDLLLRRIERLICYETNDLSQNCFSYQYFLEHIGFEGVIGKSINVRYCPLSVESMNKLFACLKDYSTIGGTYTVTLKADRQNMLTEEEKAVATNKGWTLVWS
ncbi:MAG: hypothetical protein U0L88_06340 [Acutalibacteraceae bacterium]|nr:hypothetical protein [Acutalibacteraceae bacterium]